MKIDNFIFDFGGVLVDWNPRYLFDSLFTDKEALDYFLSEICTSEWEYTARCRTFTGRGYKSTPGKAS